jgi:hypothetical protein
MAKFTRRDFIKARCAAYAGIIRTVKDTAAYMRGEATL